MIITAKPPGQQGGANGDEEANEGVPGPKDFSADRPHPEIFAPTQSRKNLDADPERQRHFGFTVLHPRCIFCAH
jgi:hypothetical protein